MAHDIQKIAPLIYFSTMSLCRTDITPGQISLWIFLNLVGWKTGVESLKWLLQQRTRRKRGTRSPSLDTVCRRIY